MPRNDFADKIKELYNSEKVFRTIIDSSPDGITVLNEHGLFEFANDSFIKIIGWPEEEIIGNFFLKMIPDDEKEFVMEHWKGIQTDLGGNHEIKIITISGIIKHLSVSSSLVEINGKNIIVVVVHDITENKRLEINLKESYERYKELFDHASDCIYTIDLNGQFLTVNDSLVRGMKGDSVEEILASNFFNWMTQESMEKEKKFIQEVIAQKDNYNRSVVIEIIRKDGIHVWFEHKARPIKDNNNNIIGLHGICRDITEKRRMEQELKESEEKYRDLFENAYDFMYVHDLKGSILNINKIGSHLLGATKEEIIGSNIKEWLSPQSFQMFEERVRKIFLNQPVEEPVVVEGITRRGERKWGEATTRLIKDGDKIIGIQGIFRDITERIRLEKELKESEEKYRDLFENAQDAMYVLDNELNFLQMNKFGNQTLGCSKEEVIGSNISRWVTPESLRIIYERRRKSLSGEKVTPTDILEVVCKNGEHRWVEIRNRVIRSDDERIEYHGIARDITENRLLKQELNKSNKQQKLLCHLIQGTRGGKTRALILKHLCDQSYNANELATALNIDYKTVRHHLNVLIKNGIIGKSNDGSYDLYFIVNNRGLDLNE